MCTKQQKKTYAKLDCHVIPDAPPAEVEAGIPGVIYGAEPKIVLQSHAKRSDERLNLEDLRRATKVIARTLHDLLAQGQQ